MWQEEKERRGGADGDTYPRGNGDTYPPAPLPPKPKEERGQRCYEWHPPPPSRKGKMSSQLTIKEMMERMGMKARKKQSLPPATGAAQEVTGSERTGQEDNEIYEWPLRGEVCDRKLRTATNVNSQDKAKLSHLLGVNELKKMKVLDSTEHPSHIRTTSSNLRTSS